MEISSSGMVLWLYGHQGSRLLLSLCSTYLGQGFHHHGYLMTPDGYWISAIVSMFQAGGRREDREKAKGVHCLYKSVPGIFPYAPHITLHLSLTKA